MRTPRTGTSWEGEDAFMAMGKLNKTWRVKSDGTFQSYDDVTQLSDDNQRRHITVVIL